MLGGESGCLEETDLTEPDLPLLDAQEVLLDPGSIFLSEPPFPLPESGGLGLSDPEDAIGEVSEKDFELSSQGQPEQLDGEVQWYNMVRDEPPQSDVGAVCTSPPLEDRQSRLPDLDHMPSFSCDQHILAMQETAMLFCIKKARVERPRQPWESGPFGEVFGNFSDRNSHEEWLWANAFSEVGLQESLDPPRAAPSLPTSDEGLSWVVEKRLQHFRLEKSDEDLRNHAVNRLRSLVMLDPLASKLGCTLATDIRNLASEEDIASAFDHVFVMKAASTIYKRSCSLGKFASWLMGRSGSPLRFSESQLYQYLKHLEKNAGATAGTHLLEAIRFLDGLVKLNFVDVEEVVSSRCRGLARQMHLGKRPLCQKQELTAGQVEVLERFMMRCSTRHGCIAGQLLFCFHAGSRWRDSQTLQRIFVTVDEDSGFELLQGEALTSKTTYSLSAKCTLLPYAAIGLGLSGVPWARRWITARKAENLVDGTPFLPTFSERSGRWGTSKMSSSEAAIYLREFLMSEIPASTGLEKLGTHSLKRTLLMWAGKSSVVFFSKSDRRLLGHHVDPKDRSMLVYSIEAYTTLYGRVSAMFESIRSLAFNPDLKAASRVVAVAEGLLHGPDPDQAAFPSEARELDKDLAEDSDADSLASCSGVEMEERDGLARVRPPFSDVSWSQCVTHVISGITHLKRDESTLLCGRPLSDNYKPTEAVSEVAHFEPDCCHQCNRVLLSEQLP